MISNPNTAIHNFFIEREGQTYLRVNDDDDLRPWLIPMPAPPPARNIDGFGLTRDNQFFRYATASEKLNTINEEVIGDPDTSDERRLRTLKEIKQLLFNYQREYREEIQWIKKQWHRIEYGYWFYNNGTPTYIDGDNYAYMNFWDVGSYRPDGLPEYRLRDTIYFLVTRHVELSPKILGLLYYKFRREGATFKTICKLYFHCIRDYRRKVGIQSLTEKHVLEAWDEKFIVPWQKLPFFLKPEWSGTDHPVKDILFSPKARVVSKDGAYASVETGLGSTMIAETSGISNFDSYKLTRYYMDEFGKRHAEKPVDSFDRYMRVRECLIEGDEKVGTAFGTSTVGDEKEDEGGVEYAWKFYENSKYWEESSTGMTNTGLRPLFIPSHVNLPGFNDKFGNPISENSDVGIENTKGEKKYMGSRTFLAERLRQLQEKGNWVTINEQKRKFPEIFMDCFKTSSARAMFNQEILSERILSLEKNRLYETLLRVGRIEPMDSRRPFEDMHFVDDADGKWNFSQQPLENIANTMWVDTRMILGNKLAPRHSGKYTVGCDPGKYEETERGIKSKSAITVKRTWDSVVDTAEKKPGEWVSDQYVADLIMDVDDIDLFAYEALKACIFFSTSLYGENNIYDVNKYFKRVGYHGFLMYDMDETGKTKVQAGHNMNGQSKPSGLLKFSQYIERRGKWENHIRLLKQAASIRNPKQLTNKDLLASAICNLFAEESLYSKFVSPTSTDDVSIQDMYPG